MMGWPMSDANVSPIRQWRVFLLDIGGCLVDETNASPIRQQRF